MTLAVQRVQIKRLFDQFDLDVPIEDNTIIIVGENGSGKSTLINLIFFALTAQWSRMREVPFASCTLTLSGKDYTIVRESKPKTTPNSDDAGYALRYFRRQLGPRADDLTRYLDSQHPSYWLARLPELRRKVSQSFSPVAFGAVQDYLKGSERQLGPEIVGDIESLETCVRSSLSAQLLFLPTYRRIEKELRALFPDLDLDKAVESLHQSRSVEPERAYVEFVEFGMTDVADHFKATLSGLDRAFRNELNRLTGSYLRDIIRGQYKTLNTEELASPEIAKTVDVMLSRIEDDILPQRDRERLRKLLKQIAPGQELDGDQRILAHFLSKLVGIHREQQESEHPIRQFVTVCNEYLQGKHLVFDPLRFTLTLLRLTDTTDSAGQGATIPLQGLSSGEKQIVSLFTHMYLSGGSDYIVLIDEPELSISVAWQRRFLSDLKASGRCVGLLAVTHSPFIFENELSQYAHSMGEFLRPSVRRPK